MNHRILIFLIISLLINFPSDIDAKKQGYRLKTPKEKPADLKEEQMSKGSFMVASQCPDCNNGYRIDQISFSGYDKPQQSAKETFFITNHTDRTMSGITLYIEYLTPDGRQLSKRFLRLTCNIPPGETRIADIESWDKQRRFYYTGSTPSRRGGAEYTVVFDPVSYYLRY